MEEQKQTKKPKRINSKKKGSSFELNIAHRLTAALAPLNFRRTQQSGAIVGGKNEKAGWAYSQEMLTLMIGDVAPVNELDVIRDQGWKLKFTIECKFYRDMDNLEHLVDKTRILGWYDKARSDAQKLNKQALLIFKFNHSSLFLALEAQPEWVLPKSVKNYISLHREGQPDLRIFFMDDALKDLDWWKVPVQKNIQDAQIS